MSNEQEVVLPSKKSCAKEFVAALKTGDINGALAINAELAEELPGCTLIERWCLAKIERSFNPVVKGKAALAWQEALANAPEGLIEALKAGEREWAEKFYKETKATLEGKERLAELSGRLEQAAPPINARTEAKATKIAEELGDRGKPDATEVKGKPSSVDREKTPKVEVPSILDQPLSSLAHKLKEQEHWSDAPLPPESATAFEKLSYPRGLLGHAVQYIVDTSQLPDRTMALVGALCALAKGLDRKVLGPTGNSVVLFVLLIAETGAGKQHVINCIRMLMRAMGEEGAIVASGIASVQSIEEILEGRGEKLPGKPSALVLIDEYGSFLARISSKGQGGNVAEIPSLLQTLWGWPPQLEWQGSMKVGKEVQKVYGPAFSIFGSSTERVFFTALKRKEVSSGFVNRHLLLNAGRGWIGERVKPGYDWSKCPIWLVTALKKVAGDPAPTNNQPLAISKGDRVVRILHDYRRIGWTELAEAKWLKFEGEVRGMPSSDDRELWIRAPEIALRLATIVAVFRGSRVIDAEDIEWAIELAQHSTRHLARGLSAHQLEEYEQAELVDLIREAFKRADDGVLKWGDIRRLCERKAKKLRDIDEAIEHLIYCGDIEELPQPPGPGKPTRRWQWTR